MSLYQCDKCGCIENTTLGHYHTRSISHLWPPEYLNKKLCSVCGPTHFISGEKSHKDMGKWHGVFKRTYLPKDMFETDPGGNLWHKETHEEPVPWKRDTEWPDGDKG